MSGRVGVVGAQRGSSRGIRGRSARSEMPSSWLRPIGHEAWVAQSAIHCWREASRPRICRAETSSTLSEGSRAPSRTKRPTRSGKRPGVGGAEEGAVGVAEQVERVLAEDGAHHVEVARGADRVDVFEEAAGVVAASRRRGRVSPSSASAIADCGLSSPVSMSSSPALRSSFSCVGHAEDGGGVADAARVEGDDVVGLDDGFAEALGRSSRAARRRRGRRGRRG